MFCCFNGAQKIYRATFERWLDILSQVEGGVLWLLDRGPEASANLRAHAADRGIEPERIVFAPKLANRDHLARYRLADLVLDSAPYGAHTTASDALWMGVPVLTLSGLSFASRVCGSLVRSAGLPELVVEDPAAYVALAVALAADPDALPVLKARLEAGRATCPLFDMNRLAADLEALYRQVCAAHHAGRTPQPDLANLPAYLQAGLDLAGEAGQTQAAYEARYRQALAARHRVRPLPADNRLWTGAPPPVPLALVAKS